MQLVIQVALGVVLGFLALVIAVAGLTPVFYPY